jgi:ornithine cyclodeaminase/alanine dehydrogenase-like protein (mu-crystallin family)
MHEPGHRPLSLIGSPAGSEPALLLGRAEVERALSLEMAFESQVMAFMSLAEGEAVVAERKVFRSRSGAGYTVSHAARVTSDAGVVGKLVSVVEENPARGLPTVVGVVTVVDPHTGRLAALMEGTAITTLRTAAASAVAAATLAREPLRRLAVIGSGVQGRAHVRAIAKARQLRQVRVYSRAPEHREQAAADLGAELEIDVRAASSVEDAVRGADVVALCTHSANPVLLGDWVEPGAVVISVGSYSAERREVDDRLLERAARIVVDHRESARAHAGPVIRALEMGLLRPDQLVELGQVLVGEDPGRRDPAEVIFYNSVGIGVQDAAAAWVALQRARQLGLGTPIDLGQ